MKKVFRVFNVGEKVIAPMQYGYAPVHGEVIKIWVNERGVMMASVYYGRPEDINSNRWDRPVVLVPMMSLKPWEE